MDDQVLQRYEGGGELSLSRPAETVLKEAEMVAGPWSKKVESLQLYKKIGDSKHLYIEAWQMVAAMYRVTARVRETRYVDMGEVRGYECTAEAYHIPSGQVLSTADAMCLSDEDKWGPRTKYEWIDGKKEATGFVNTPLQQLRSMAQTRACSKVLSNLFKWIARLKGYQGTPAEEMTGHESEEQPGEPKGANFKPPQRKAQDPPAEQSNGEPVITEAQGKRLYAIAMNKGWDKENYAAWMKTKGFKHSREVPAGQYDALVAALEAA